jgi:hypothetical protein
MRSFKITPKLQIRPYILIGAITLTLLLVLFLVYTIIRTAHAAGLASWSAGNIISDSVFMNKDSMNPTQIQSFLQSKTPNCDTWGTQPSEFGGGTRAQWGAAHNNPAPFICLKDYSENGKGAAQIIFDTAQEFSINPQVLIVLLQKEQGLVTDTWPLNAQYRTATGYGCPDTAACDSKYFGLTNQLRWSARMFKAIMNNSPSWYTPYVLGNNTIYYSPGPYDTTNSRYYGRFGDRPDIQYCSSSTVHIQNRATQALYNYTPYQPNQAALNAGYGSAPPCGSYGNRNFYLYFTDWFGSTIEGTVWRWSYITQSVHTDTSYTRPVTAYEPSVQPGGLLYAEVKALNTGNQTWDDMTRLATSRQPGRSSIFTGPDWLSSNRPAALLETKVPPGGVGTFRFIFHAPQAIGTYREYFNLVADGKTSLNDPGLYFAINVTNPVPTRNTVKTSLLQGQALKKNEFLLSPDTNSCLVLQNDGNLVLYEDFIPTWSSATKNLGGTKLIFQLDGNVVLYTDTMKPVWASGTDGSTANNLRLQTDGNLVLYNTSSGVSWQSGTSHSPDHLNAATRIIPSGGVMIIGQRIETVDRSTMLFFQSDGNVVLYRNGQPLWATGTDGKDSERLIMQGDGNLVLYDRAMRPIWYSQTANQGPSRLELQNDNNLVIYRNDGMPSWATYTNK